MVFLWFFNVFLVCRWALWFAHRSRCVPRTMQLKRPAIPTPTAGSSRAPWGHVASNAPRHKTTWTTLIIHIFVTRKPTFRVNLYRTCGLTYMALIFKTNDCRFESCQSHCKRNFAHVGLASGLLSLHLRTGWVYPHRCEPPSAASLMTRSASPTTTASGCEAKCRHTAPNAPRRKQQEQHW